MEGLSADLGSDPSTWQVSWQQDGSLAIDSVAEIKICRAMWIFFY